ncbi:hypothetical protein MSSIT_3183 [Methanosarcina siciliae T4/M]|uniref:Uncharacterized protein n=1 Tax=Methanosarcina siciliae T4/M TaxID=1434120 RepID=A0A0E3P7M7_9EURY|nr:hypothetical protein [Methanosarcina siciliae]AKB29902.1 hypothetical protein MSSIT_3183 [Methanosarcina siciliae T4/M]
MPPTESILEDGEPDIIDIQVPPGLYQQIVIGIKQAYNAGFISTLMNEESTYPLAEFLLTLEEGHEKMRR